MNRQVPLLLKKTLKRNAKIKAERVEEDQFVFECRARGWKTRKLNGVGQRDWPDQMVVIKLPVQPWHIIRFVEFKSKSGKLTPGQFTMFHWLTPNVYLATSCKGALDFMYQEINKELG